MHDLLKPRYKVIADYPMSQFRIGDILEMVISDREIWTCQRTGSKNMIDVSTYPAIFKPLQWWKDRIFVDAGHEGKYVKEFDLMPQFIKSKSTGNIYKVIWYGVNEFGDVSCLVESEHGNKYKALQDMEPATKEEFEQYKSTHNEQHK